MIHAPLNGLAARLRELFTGAGLLLGPIVALLVFNTSMTLVGQGPELGWATSEGTSYSAGAIAFLCSVYFGFSCACAAWLVFHLVPRARFNLPTARKRFSALIWTIAVLCVTVGTTVSTMHFVTDLTAFLSLATVLTIIFVSLFRGFGPLHRNIVKRQDMVFSVAELALFLGAFLTLGRGDVLLAAALFASAATGFICLRDVWQLALRISKIFTYRVTISLSVALWLAGATAFASNVFEPVATARLLSPIGVTCLAFGFWSLTFAILVVVLPNANNLPALTVPFVVLLVPIQSCNDNHEIRFVPQDAGSPQRPTLHEHLTQWLKARKDEGAAEPLPLIVVATEGGGIRAAAWTSQVLQRLDQSTHGKFTRHTFAISGVSGGSLGATSFVAAVASQGDCLSYRGLNAVSSHQLDMFLQSDFLSPIVGMAVFQDALQRALPFPVRQFDRARGFELGIESSWKEYFHTDIYSDTVHKLSVACPGSLPALLLNATEAGTGKRFLVSTLDLDQKYFFDSFIAFSSPATKQHDSMPLSTAVHLSARFPILSPAGVISRRRLSPDDFNEALESNGFSQFNSDNDAFRTGVWGRVVDGGYFDNSGIVSALDLIRAIRAECRVPGCDASALDIQLVVIANRPARISLPIDKSSQLGPTPAQSRLMEQQRPEPFLERFVPSLLAMWGVRDAHSTYAMSEASRTLIAIEGAFTSCSFRYKEGLGRAPMAVISLSSAIGERDDTGLNFSVTRTMEHRLPPLGWTLRREVHDEMKKAADADPVTQQLASWTSGPRDNCQSLTPAKTPG